MIDVVVCLHCISYKHLIFLVFFYINVRIRSTPKMSLLMMRKNQKAEKELEDTNVVNRTRRTDHTMSEREKDKQRSTKH